MNLLSKLEFVKTVAKCVDDVRSTLGASMRAIGESHKLWKIGGFTEVLRGHLGLHHHAAIQEQLGEADHEYQHATM